MSKRAILFVDDETALLSLVGGALEDEGFDVTRAQSGADALDLLVKGRVFDFIISDVSMPDGVTGMELAHRASELLPEARIILTSGHPKARLGAFPEDAAFLPKPYRLGQLLGMVD